MAATMPRTVTVAVWDATPSLSTRALIVSRSKILQRPFVHAIL
jgi:hypothetical protein